MTSAKMGLFPIPSTKVRVQLGPGQGEMYHISKDCSEYSIWPRREPGIWRGDGKDQSEQKLNRKPDSPWKL